MSKSGEALNLDPVIEKLRTELPDLLALYHFGSSRLNPAVANDIDLAFLLDRRLDPVQRFALQEECAILMKRHCDLSELKGATPVFACEVFRTGERIFCADESAANFFEVRMMSQYAHLNEERREILAAVAERGRVHGG